VVIVILARQIAGSAYEGTDTLRQSLVEKSKLTHHACGEGHQISWKEANFRSIFKLQELPLKKEAQGRVKGSTFIW
jgi:hypothetical protein